jgi:endoglucanase
VRRFVTVVSLAAALIAAGGVPAHATTFWVEPGTDAARAAAATDNPQQKAALTRMARTPTAVWLGDWEQGAALTRRVDASLTAAARAHQVPVFVLYDIPHRECGAEPTDGASDAASYKAWFAAALAGIRTRRALVVLEPDALPQLDCLTHSQQVERYQLLHWAIGQLAAHTSLTSYVDAGNSAWKSPAEMATRLRAVGSNRIKGFSLNVANFRSTASSKAYGHQLSAIAGGHFVVDTSRNGAATATDWCNPSGQRLGQAPTTTTGDPLADALLWVKHPGASDGTCNGGPNAGVFWTAYALGLAGL